MKLQKKETVLSRDSIFEGKTDKPRLTAFAGIGICLEGACDVFINAQGYHLKKGDMCLVLPDVMLQTGWKSSDFTGYTIAVTREFLDSTGIPMTTSFYLPAQENPCISLDGNETERFMALCDELKRLDRHITHPYRHEISQSLAMAIVYKIAAVYHERLEVQHFSRSRKNMLFMKFRQLVAIHHCENRKIDFYANKLCISEHYLSIIVKHISGLTASACIERFVIASAKSLLVSTEMTILQVSDRLNFPNASFFSKYFKRITGQTPKEYRNKM
ncbi:MAG: AraC family transcriptional regulator [Tannerella sp.]|jgi:AraC-like DNA-binding protein|nr:AraC family transcriptional regulator [Tannerella sp.]